MYRIYFSTLKSNRNNAIDIFLPHFLIERTLQVFGNIVNYYASLIIVRE